MQTKNQAAVELGKLGGKVRSQRKTEAVTRNARKPRTGRIARIEQVDADTIVVRYHGVIRHIERFDAYQVSGAIVNRNLGEANDKAEAWAKANGFTGVRWQ
jgi:hypothetical protein